MEKYIRAKGVAERIGISVSTVWEYAKKGLLTPIKLSSRVTVFKIEEIDALLDSLTTPTAQKVA